MCGCLEPPFGGIFLGTTPRFLVNSECIVKAHPRATRRCELINASGSTRTGMGSYGHAYGCLQLQKTRWRTSPLFCGY